MIALFYLFLLSTKIVCLIPNVNNKINKLFPKKSQPKSFQNCYDDLGCVKVTEQWYHETHRPINVEPLERNVIRTEFILYTLPNDSSNSHHLDYEIVTSQPGALAKSRFNKKQDVVLLIHDFTSNGYTGWFKHIARSILDRCERNVIGVDWQGGAEPPFEQAVANARVVALEVVLLLKCIKTNFELDGDRIQIIGHGLGAQIAGYVGDYTKDLKKITALDPTGPYFEGMPNFVRLDPSDAKYVEVIHTDAYGPDSQGTSDHMGHKDFFINGPHKQPGCNDSNSNLDLVAVNRNSLKQGQILPGCSHKRSFKYFIESIESTNCKFIGFNCDDFDTFVEGHCTSTELALFDLNSFETNAYVVDKGFFLITDSQAPFCLIPYKIEMKVCNNTQTPDNEVGYIDIIIKGENNEVVNGTSNFHGKSQTFSKGQYKELLVYAEAPEVSVFKEIEIKWMKKGGAVCPSMVCKNSLFITSISISGLPSGSKTLIELCPKSEETELKHNYYHTFKLCTECEDKSHRSAPNDKEFIENKLESDEDSEDIEETNEDSDSEYDEGK